MATVGNGKPLAGTDYLFESQQTAINAAIAGTGAINRAHSYEDIGDQYLGAKIVVGITLAVAVVYIIWFVKKHR